MYKMLIADDEPAVRQYLRYIVKQYDLPFVICGEAEDGEQAVRIAAEQEPKFFILDINMPIMNGLEAAKIIREKQRDAIIYILTAYSQFEYAHQALQTQVAGYLLKPIKPVELVDTLKKGIAIALNQHMAIERVRRMERQIEKDKPVVIKHKLFELLQHDVDNPQALAVLRHIAKRGDFCPQAVVSAAYWPAASVTPVVGLEERLSEECATRFGEQVLVAALGEEIVMIFQEWDQHWQRLLQRQLSEWEQTYKILVCAAVSQIARPSQLGLEYKKSQKRRETGLFWQQQGLLVAERFSEETKEIEYDIILQQLRDCLVERQIDKAKRLIHHFLCDIKHSVWQPEQIYAVLIKIANNLIEKYAEYVIATEDANQLRRDFISQLNKTTTISGVEACLYGLVDKLNNSCGSEQSQAEQAVNWAIEYIHNNYHKDLTLEQIAEKLFMSTGYFCRVFKKYAGEGYAAYVTNVRLKKARERLMSGKYTVAEVGRMVGFRDASYFSSVFKKHYNQSPSLLAAKVTKSDIQ